MIAVLCLSVFLAGVGAAFIVSIILSACVVSGRISRAEERR